MSEVIASAAKKEWTTPVLGATGVDLATVAATTTGNPDDGGAPAAKKS